MSKNRVICYNKVTVLKAQGTCTLADVNRHCKMTSVMVLVTWFWCLKEDKNTCKRMQNSPTIAGFLQCNGGKVGRSWRLQMCFVIYCVRIEIDQLECINCWGIIHCLSVSCKKINHLRCTLVIWSSLQLTSKQWIITQQFTARADLFLK